MKHGGEEKGKLIFLLPITVAIYTDCGATSDVFSAHAGTWTLNIWALYVLYNDLYALCGQQDMIVPVHILRVLACKL
jgi:hypothetical protein